MKHAAFAPAVLLCSIGIASTAFAQSKPAQAPATKAAATAPAQAPAAPAKFVKPVKGTATIALIKGSPNRVGRRHRDGDEDQEHVERRDQPAESRRVSGTTRSRMVVTGDTQSYRKPFLPGRSSRSR